MKKNNSAVKTVSLIIFATMFSKVLGLLRSILMIAYYGSTEDNKVFLTASRIPLTFFDLIFGAAILGVFIPIYNSMRKTTGEAEIADSAEADNFANVFISVILFVTGILSFLGIIFSKQLVMLIAPGYDEAAVTLASNLLKILFPTIMFIGSTYILSGILQSKDEFLVPALVSAVSNLGVILYFLFLNKYFGIHGLACAYLASWVIQLITLAVPLKKKKYKYKFIIDFKNPELIRAIKTTIPIMTGSWLMPVGMLVGQKYASMSENNNVTVPAFENSTQVFLLITGILVHGICNYIFPKLSQNASEKSRPEFVNIVKNGLSAVFFIIIPVSCIAYILRGEITTVLFLHGKVTEEMARAIADMLSALLPAMIMFAVIEILNRVFYSKNMPKYPMIASVCGILLNMLLCEIFIVRAELSPVYISAACLCAQSLSALILVIALAVKIKGVFDRGFFVNLIKTAVSAGALFGLMWIIYGAVNNNAFSTGTVKNILVAVAFGIGGIAVYLGVNIVLKTELIAFLSKRKKQ